MKTLVVRMLVFFSLKMQVLIALPIGGKWPQGERYNRFQRPHAAPPPVHLADPACLTPRTSHNI